MGLRRWGSGGGALEVALWRGVKLLIISSGNDKHVPLRGPGEYFLVRIDGTLPDKYMYMAKL